MHSMERRQDRAVKATPAALTPEQLAEIGRGVEIAVAVLARRRVPIDLEDAQQQAWVAGLEAAANWRPDGGAALASYTVRAARTSVYREARRAACPVTASKGVLRRMQAAGDPALHPARPDQSPAARRAVEAVAQAPAPGGGPDRSEEGERTARLLRRAAYRRALARLAPRDRRIAEAVVSRAWLGLPVGQPGAWVEAEGLGTRKDAARALRALREAMLEERAVWEAARPMILGEEP